MSTNRLKLYNEALTICSERALASLTENREPRRLLDAEWDNDGVKNCLEDAQWKFAKRTVLLDYDPTYAPQFGYRRAFAKPTDWCNTQALCSDEYFNTPLTQYSDEGGFWYCDLNAIYAQYTSNDAAYGGDLSQWTSKFADFVSAHFASKIILKMTSDKEKLAMVIKLREKAKREATNLDAMSDPTKFLPDGSWVSARRGRGSNRRDGGNRNSLIG